MDFCKICNKKYSVYFTVRKENQFVKSDKIFLEKLSCGCGDIVFYNNKFQNWVFYPKIRVGGVDV